MAYPLEVINEEGRRNVNFECLRGDERRSYSRVLSRECHPWSLECVIGQTLSTFVLRVCMLYYLFVCISISIGLVQRILDLFVCVIVIVIAIVILIHSVF